MPSAESRFRFNIVAVCLMIAFSICISSIGQESLWTDEAWTDWAIRSPYLKDTLERVRSDVHPPLYFLLLDGWSILVGDSEFSLRLPSALFGLIGLATTYTISKHLFDRRTGLIAIVILSTASFFVYYTREARMYSLLLALSALSTWSYLRWRQKSSLARGLLYGLSMGMLLYTHYAGALIVVSQVVHLALTRPRTLRSILPYGLALLVFLPWLPTFLNQIRANPNGPLAIPVATDWAAVVALLLILTSGQWGLMLVSFVVGDAIPRIRQYVSAILLLFLWLLITPVGLLALNAWFAPVYQIRYTIAMLPAGALLVAYGLRHVGLPEGIAQRIGVRARHVASLRAALTILLLLWLAYTQVTTYREFWAEKSPWKTVIGEMIAAREPLEPIITDFAPYSPSAYYDHQLHVRQGIALDLSWRLHSAIEARERVRVFESEPLIWVALPINTAKTWHIVAELDATRHIGYRSALVNMIFYRFDQGNSNDLQFRFDDLVRYVSGPGAEQQFTVRSGDELCAEITLQTIGTLDGSYSAGLHLIDLSGQAQVAAWDEGLGVHAGGEMLDLKPCLSIAPTTSPDHYHLELVIYNWATLRRLPLIEERAGEVGWGDVLMMAAVDVTE